MGFLSTVVDNTNTQKENYSHIDTSIFSNKKVVMLMTIQVLHFYIIANIYLSNGNCKNSAMSDPSDKFFHMINIPITKLIAEYLNIRN